MEIGKKLISLPPRGKVILVGDTHGDLEASQIVIKKYLKLWNKVIFLGDYVDRGPKSKENIDYLLSEREKNSEQLYLLLGNHDGCNIIGCYPRDFWNSLAKGQVEYYANQFSKLPLAVSVGDIIALHGGLPSINSLDEIDNIKDGDENWEKIVWGDFQEIKGRYLGRDARTGRPQFGTDYFNELMERYNKKVLIRAHQSGAPELMYDKRCLTIFTSSAYSRKRIAAIADLEKDIENAKDLTIEEI